MNATSVGPWFGCVRRRPARGFTLTELLVVIAILSLLVSMLLPSLRKARDLAKTVVCKTNLRSIGTGFHLYAAENDGRIPYDENLTSWSPHSHNNDLPHTGGKLYPDYLPAPVVADRYDFQSPAGLLACPAYSLQPDTYPDPVGRLWKRKPLEGVGRGGAAMPTNMNHEGAAHATLFRTYRTNDLPADHAANHAGIAKGPARLGEIRSSRLILAFESHTKGFACGWEAVYFNPRHRNAGVAVHLDNSVRGYPIDERTLAPSGYSPYNPNSVNQRDVVDAWGNYLDPDYIKPY